MAQSDADMLPDLSILDHLSRGAIVTDAQLDPPGPTILYVNDTFLSFADWDRADLIGQTPRVLQGPLTDQTIVTDLRTELEEAGVWHGQTINYRKTGSTFIIEWSITPIRNGDGRVLGYVAIIDDVTERVRLGRSIAGVPQTDRQTGLLLYDEFRNQVEGWIDRFRRNECAPPLVAHLEIDDFVQVSAVTSPLEMSMVRIILAQRMVQHTPGAVLGQSAQDRFLLATDDIELLDTLRGVLTAPVALADKRLHLRVTIGVALCPIDGEGCDELIRAAIIATAEGHHLGSNHLCLYFGEFSERMARTRRLEDALTVAAQEQQFQIVYQPKLSTADGLTVHGVESLLRWSHPVFGDVPPSEFIPILEATGRITSVTNWVCDRVLWQQNQWRRHNLLMRVGINVSQLDLLADAEDLRRRLAEGRARYDLRANLIEIEITERIAANPEMQKAIAQLANDGYLIAIDDFGREQSTLATLVTYAVDVLKLDKELVADCAENNRRRIVLRHVAAMARDLGMLTVAEGVEDRATLELLTEMEIDLIQGFAVAKPMSADDLAAFMAGRVSACGPIRSSGSATATRLG